MCQYAIFHIFDLCLEPKSVSESTVLDQHIIPYIVDLLLQRCHIPGTIDIIAEDCSQCFRHICNILRILYQRSAPDYLQRIIQKMGVDLVLQRMQFRFHLQIFGIHLFVYFFTDQIIQFSVLGGTRLQIHFRLLFPGLPGR